MNLTTISIAHVKEAEKNFDVFPATDLPSWERAAKDELQGLDPWKKLTQEVQGIEIKPFYATGPASIVPTPLLAAENTFLGPRTWYNSPRVIVRDPIQANAVALEHLKQGANGIYFELEDAVDFSVLLKSIEWPYCSLNFLAKENTSAITKELERVLSHLAGQSHGALFGTHQILPLKNHSFRFIGTEIFTGIHPIEALAEGIVSMDRLLGDSLQARSTEVAFSVEVGTDFFFEISKLRALRIVWQKLLAYRSTGQKSPLFIHTWSRPWINETYSPHGNMLKATTASMASILGGCDVLTVDAEDSENTTMRRAARNVSNVLREESHFSKVADPLAGSYFLDDLTRQLSEQIWQLVQPRIKP